MQNSVINIGDKIEMLQVRSNTGLKVSQKRYTSQLLEYNGMRSAKVSMPIYEGKVIPLQVNGEYDLCFFTSAGLYRCRAKVVNRFRERKMFVLVMEFLSMPKKYQRRQFYRLECMEKIRYRIITEEETTLKELIANGDFKDDPALRKAYEKKLEEIQSKWDWEPATLTDISGGGVRLQCGSGLDAGSLIELSMKLFVDGEQKPIQCMAKVVTSLKSKGGNLSVDLRCEYEDIGRVQREIVVKFVYEEQKRRMRKD